MKRLLLIVWTLAPNLQARQLDHISDFFKDNLAGKTFQYIQEHHAQKIHHYMAINNIRTFEDSMRYNILYSKRATENGSNLKIDKVLFECELGARNSNDGVVGICSAVSASDRVLNGKAAQMIARFTDGRVILDESTLLYADLPNPATGELFPGATQSTIVLYKAKDGGVRIRERVRFFKVDTVSLQRTEIGTPIEHELVEML